MLTIYLNKKFMNFLWVLGLEFFTQLSYPVFRQFFNHTMVIFKNSSCEKYLHIMLNVWFFFFQFMFFILQFRTGLPLSTYFSAVKLRWLLDNVEEIRQAVDDGRAMFGTIDSWLIWVCICEFIITLLKMDFYFLYASS